MYRNSLPMLRAQSQTVAEQRSKIVSGTHFWDSAKRMNRYHAWCSKLPPQAGRR